MFFIEKPAINIMYEHIEQVEFQRHSQITSNRNFDLEVKLRPSKSVNLGGRPKNSVTFSHIAREERNAFVSMFRQKEITLKGLLDDNDEVVAALGAESDGDDDDEDRPKVQKKRPAEGAPKPGAAKAGGAGDDEDSEHDSDFGGEESSESDELEYASKASSESDEEGEGEASNAKKPKTGDDE